MIWGKNKKWHGFIVCYGYSDNSGPKCGDAWRNHAASTFTSSCMPCHFMVGILPVLSSSFFLEGSDINRLWKIVMLCLPYT